MRTLSFQSTNATKNLDEEDREIRTEMANGGDGHFPAVNMTSYTFKKEKGTDGKIHEVPIPKPVLSTNLKSAM